MRPSHTFKQFSQDFPLKLGVRPFYDCDLSSSEDGNPLINVPFLSKIMMNKKNILESEKQFF